MKFNYQARTKEGETQTGTVEAGTREAAIETLQRHDLVVVFLEKVSEVPIYARSLKFLQRIKVKEITIFYRQLAILFEANISPLEALKILGEQTRNPLFKNLIFDVEKDIRAGEPLSQAMAKHPKVFSNFYINVVKAGEATGKLHEVLKYLADHAEREYNLNHKIRGAFTYPAFIFGLFAIVAVLMMVYVVPQLTLMLEEVGGELPFATKVLIFTSSFLKKWIWLVVLIVIGLAVALMRFIKTEKGRYILDVIKLKIPVFKSLFQKMYLARFAENLRTLLIGGIPILKALDITATVVGNKIYEKIIKEAREKVKVGGNISSAFANYPKEITPMVSQMVGVGEKTAQLDYILERIAIFYKEEVDRTVANMTQLIEPFMILILGIGVAFLVSSILMPIYNISMSL
ncbi:putative type II secretion system protein F [subsurface metagenome]